MVDDGWKAVEVEPEAIAVNGNGYANDIGPSVELVVGSVGHANGANGNASVPVKDHAANGNGRGSNGTHSSDPGEGQQSLFSWAEFMAEEPVKPRSRSRKPATTSLFEWALTLEEERVA